MRIIVINSEGPGAVIGMQLERAGHCVKYLDHRRRAAALQFSPLVVRSDFGDYNGYARTVEAAELFSPHDLIIVAGDAADVPKIAQVLPRAVGSSTIILSLAAGIENIDLLRGACPGACVLDGYQNLVTQLDEHGTVIHNAAGGDQIMIASRSAVEIAAARSVIALFDKTDLDVQAVQKVAHLHWTRMVLLVSVCGLSALMQARIVRIGAIEAGYEQLWLVLQECGAVADSAGQPVHIAELSAFMDRLPRSVPVLVNAMLNRIDRGDLREVTALVAQMYRAARAGCTATPGLDLIHTALAARAAGAKDEDTIELITPSPKPAPRFAASGWISRLRAARRQSGG